MAVKLTQDEAVQICEAVGFSRASSWNKKRMKQKLGEVFELARDGGVDLIDTLDEDARGQVNTLISSVVGEGGKFTFGRGDGGEAAEAPAEEADEKADEKADDKPKKEKKPKSPKEKGVAGPKIDGKPEGIRSLRNRLFVAGAILRESGLSHGLTEELIREVDETLGKEKSNLVASKNQLGLAWHVVNGYLNG